MGRPVHTLFLLFQPFLQIPICRVQTHKAISSPESFPDKTVGSFHLAFGIVRQLHLVKNVRSDFSG